MFSKCWLLNCDLLTLIYSLSQVLFKDGVFQWKRLENLITLAKENVAKMSSNPALQVNSTSVLSRNQLAYICSRV